MRPGLRPRYQPAVATRRLRLALGAGIHPHQADNVANGTQRTIHLRCVTTPDEAQKVLLDRLGLTLPQRLRRIDEVEQM